MRCDDTLYPPEPTAVEARKAAIVEAGRFDPAEHGFTGRPGFMGRSDIGPNLKGPR